MNLYDLKNQLDICALFFFVSNIIENVFSVSIITFGNSAGQKKKKRKKNVLRKADLDKQSLHTAACLDLKFADTDDYVFQLG